MIHGPPTKQPNWGDEKWAFYERFQEAERLAERCREWQCPAPGCAEDNPGGDEGSKVCRRCGLDLGADWLPQWKEMN